MLPHLLLLLTSALAHPSLSSLLTIPAHTPFSGSVGMSSLASDAEIIAQLDFVHFPQDYPLGLMLDCPNCPFAVKNGNHDGGYMFSSRSLPNDLHMGFDTAGNTLNLNGHPFLDGGMRDLHNAQSAKQSFKQRAIRRDETPADAYYGALPVAYAVRVVQVRHVRLEKGGVVVFYSVDVEVLRLGGRRIDVQKVNLHVVRRGDGLLNVLPFRDVYPRDPPLPAVSVPSFLAQSGASGAVPSSTGGGISTGTSVGSGRAPSAASAGAQLPRNGTSGEVPTFASPTSPPGSGSTGAAGSASISSFLFSSFVGVFAGVFACR